MYCPKCGAQNVDGTVFCTECGNKLQREQVPNSENQSATTFTSASADSVEQPGTPNKVLVIAGFVLFAIAVVVFLLGSMGGVDLVKTVQAYQPFANSQGLPYTYEEVLNKYIQPVKWESGAINDDKHAVIISGKIKGTDDVISIQIDVTEDPHDPDIVHMNPKNIHMAGISVSDNQAVEMLFGMFEAHDAGIESLGGDEWNEHIPEHEMALTNYLLSHTFTDADGNVLTFTRNAESPAFLDSFLNEQLEHAGWSYGYQYGGYSVYDGGWDAIFNVTDEGDVDYITGAIFYPPGKKIPKAAATTAPAAETNATDVFSGQWTSLYAYNPENDLGVADYGDYALEIERVEGSGTTDGNEYYIALHDTREPEMYGLNGVVEGQDLSFEGSFTNGLSIFGYIRPMGNGNIELVMMSEFPALPDLQFEKATASATSTATPVLPYAPTAASTPNGPLTMTASGNYLIETKRQYPPSQLLDGDLTTAWAEGAPEYGIGEAVTIDFSYPANVPSMVIYNGYQKSEKLYYENARPKELGIELKGTQYTNVLDITLEDTMEPQGFTFRNEFPIERVTIKILSVYPGTKYEDTNISEIVINTDTE